MATKVIRDNQAGWLRLKAELVAMGNQRPTITVGVHADEGVSADGTPVALIASVHEYGAPSRNIPARPYLRPTFEAHHDRYAKLIRGAIIATVAKGGDLGALLRLVGEQAQKDVLKRLRSNIPPALSARTIAERQRRRGRKPRNPRFTASQQAEGGGVDNQGFVALIDTGQNLKNRIRYVVQMGGWTARGATDTGRR